MSEKTTQLSTDVPFDAEWYLAEYPDVALTGMSPWEHYARYGRLLGRMAHPSHRPDLVSQVQNDRVKSRQDATTVCVLFHAFHKDVIDEAITYIKNIPCDFDLIVTTPLSASDEAVRKIVAVFPSAEIVECPNKGRDVAPFIDQLGRLQSYSLCCKVHTKRGNTGMGDVWRKLTYDSLLGSRDIVERIIKAFQDEPRLMMAGPRDLYKDGPGLMFANEANVSRLRELLGISLTAGAPWGFFAGTMFWFRPSILSPIVKRRAELRFTEEDGVTDGKLEHALESIFGLLLADQKAIIALVDPYAEEEKQIEIVSAPASPDRELPSKSLKKIEQKIAAATTRSAATAQAPAAKPNPTPVAANPAAATSVAKQAVPHKAAANIRGGLNIPQGNETIVRGWLAKMGDARPRTAIITFDNKLHCEVEAKQYRKDLEQHKVNAGCHAFEITVPIELIDGAMHSIKLVDKESGQLIAEAAKVWMRTHDYKDFSGFLANALVSPVIYAPFREEDKRCFAMAENIARRLAKKGRERESRDLVSVIMPVHNRVAVVRHAVDSVLAQDYRNFELIVVDDGSSDGSIEVLKAIDDPRVVLLRSEKCEGVSRARNKALAVAKGKYIAYLDSDNTWDPRYLAATVGAFRELRDAHAVYSGQFLFRGDSPVPFAARYGSYNRSLLRNKNYIDLNAFAHTKYAYDKVGGFDEELRRFVDWDLILRISERVRMYSVPVFLSNYYFDKVSNTITSNADDIKYLDVVRRKAHERTNVAATASAAGKQDYALKRKVTVIIPSYNALDDLRQCLESLEAAQGYERIDVIVVDNASDAPVVEYLERAASERKIKLIKNSINYGFTYAVNQGIAASAADSDIVLLNNDAVVTEAAIRLLQEAAYKLPECGMVVPQQILPGGTKTINDHVPYADPNFACDVNISKHHANVINPPLYNGGDYIELSFAPFFCVYIRRDVINAADGLDAEHGRHYRSDRIFCDYVRFVLRRKIYFVADALVEHKLQKATESLRTDPKKESDFEMMFRKNKWTRELADNLGFREKAWDQ